MLMVEKLFLWFLFYSCCGWVYESILVSVQQRRPVNRGFLNGPLCPIYGTGAVLAVVLLGDVHSPVLVFLISAVGASVLEYATSWVMERLFHARWWDYSNMRFNLNGRICLLGAVVFGVGGVFITGVAQPQVERWTAMLPLPAMHWLCVVFFLLLVIDTAITVAGVVDLDDRLDRMVEMVARYGELARDAVGDAVADAQDRLGQAADDVRSGVKSGVPGSVSGAVADAMADAHDRLGERWQAGRGMSVELMMKVRDAADSALNFQQRRMIASFPKLRTARHGDTLAQLRDTLERLYRRGR